MKFLFKSVPVLLVIFLLFQITGHTQELSSDANVIKQGETHFSKYCTACHKINFRLIGPPLKEVYKRKDIDWIVKFVHDSQAVIKSGDEYAVKLFNEYNKMPMTAFPDLKKEDIVAILSYIKAHDEGKVKADKPKEEAPKEESAAPTIVKEDYSIWKTLVTVMGVLTVLFVLAFFYTYFVAKKYLKTKEPQKISYPSVFDFIKSPTFIGIIVFAVVTLAIKKGIDTLYTIGIQQGYQPTQPIAFSHKIHAGQYKIDCNYCHTGAYKSKNANIPSSNICMNCHTYVNKKGSKELKKLYKHVDFKPNKFGGGKFGKNTTPVEWVRIHNLPDLSYFNHAQHTTVGKVKCQTCHGPIETMEKVYQYSNLTMGWCIDCHRTRNIVAKGNKYYTELLKIHNNKNKEKFTVEDIGGTECSKCHY